MKLYSQVKPIKRENINPDEKVEYVPRTGLNPCPIKPIIADPIIINRDKKSIAIIFFIVDYPYFVDLNISLQGFVRHIGISTYFIIFKNFFFIIFISKK